jgi:hypothetical protein
MNNDFFPVFLYLSNFMSVTCLNCKAEIQHRFCPYCGQKKDVKRLTWHSLLAEIAHFFSHIEHGFLNTCYQLLIRPGKTIKEYLQGKRQKYHKPVGFYLIWVALFILTGTMIPNWMNYNRTVKSNLLIPEKETWNYFMEHRNVFELLLIPMIALLVWLIISRPKINYIETLVLNIYAFGILNMLVTLEQTIVGLVLRTSFLTAWFETQSAIISVCWFFFCLFDVFRKERIKFFLPRILITIFLSLIIWYKLSAMIVELILKIGH